MSKADAIRAVMSGPLTFEQLIERSGESRKAVQNFLGYAVKTGAVVESGEAGEEFYTLAKDAPKRPPAERKKLREITKKAKTPKPNGSALHELTAQSLAIAAKQLATKVRACVDFEEVDELASALAAFELAERIHEKAGA